MNDVCDEFRWTASTPSELRYDVTDPTAFAYYAVLSVDARFERRPVDVAAYDALRIRFRGGPQHPSRFKVEVKSGGRLLESFVAENVSVDWCENTFELQGAFFGTIDEITLAIDHALASAGPEGSLVGTVSVDELALLCSSPLQGNP